MRASLLTLPYIKVVEHLLPLRKSTLHLHSRGDSEALRQAQKEGGLWLVMQDDDGSCNLSTNQVVSLAYITHIDWLSSSAITLQLSIEQWGRIVTLKKPVSQMLSAVPQALWPTNHDDQTEYLAQTLVKAHLHLNYSATDIILDDAWLCYRWLELLPLSVEQKQKCLKNKNAQACKQMILKKLHQM